MEQHYGNGIDQGNLAQQNYIPHTPSSTDYSHLVKTLSAWRYVLNARLLALLALLGSLGALGFAMYDPTTERLWALGIYAILCLWPVIALYLRKG